jgi:hypothetical protein
MKNLIALILMMLPMLAWGQTKATIAPIKVFGIPLGTSVEEFNNKATALNDSVLANLLHVDKAEVFLSMYEGASKNDIAWQAFASAKNKYVTHGPASTRIIATLSAKHGTPQISQTCDGIKTLRWDIKGGYIQVWSERRYGDDSDTFYMQFVDYAALKKANPELYQLIP